MKKLLNDLIDNHWTAMHLGLFGVVGLSIALLLVLRILCIL